MEQENKNPQNNKQYPEGHFIGQWMGIFIAIFSGFGIAISVTTGNYAFIGVGPALGVSIGLSVGSSIEEKYKKEGKIKPLTEKEKKSKKLLLTIGIIALVAFALTGFLLFLLHN